MSSIHRIHTNTSINKQMNLENLQKLEKGLRSKLCISVFQVLGNWGLRQKVAKLAATLTTYKNFVKKKKSTFRARHGVTHL